jgi:chaperonin GroES
MDELEMEDQGTPQEKLGAFIETVNLAEKLDKEQLEEIGKDALAGFELDLASRFEWEQNLDDWIKLAKQVVEEKSFPWPKAANVKYPLLSTAAMQFAARAYPSLIPSDGRVVKARVVGKDMDGTKTKVAEAVSIYMSYQLMEDMIGWEEDMDKLLIMLPIVGTVFKKTYWDSLSKKNCSHLVLPKNLVVNYWTKSLCNSERISEIIELSDRKIKERQMAGLWLDDVVLGDPSIEETNPTLNMPSQVDDTTPYQFIEQHTFLDLDDDDYKEPYIVTFHRRTGTVVRIVANYDDTTMQFGEGDKLVKIEPIQYYTKFGFIPNPDGGFYDIGFGVLLGPLNESANTLINQLIDAGSLNNLQGGFLGKGLRLRMGETRFAPGEWKVVNSTGDDLKKQIVPLPAKEPSKTLLDLLQMLITSGKELASVAEIFVGKMPGQNTPATTTMASIEQGMKVFTAVYKRLYRSLSEEFEKLYRLNGLYLNPYEYNEVVGMEIGPDLFDQKAQGHKVIPGADPTAVSQTEKLMKAQGLMEMLGAGMPLDPVKVMIRMLEAQEQPNWQELIPQQILQTGQMPPPPPDPKIMEMQMKGQLEQQKVQMNAAATKQKMELEARDKAVQLQMKQQEHAQEMAHKQQMAQVDAATAQHKQQIFIAAEHAKAQQGIQHAEENHQQSLRQGEEAGAAKVQQTKAQQAAKSKPAKKEPTKK